MNRTLIDASSAICSRAAPSRALRDKMDPRKSNGGVFLGLNGIVIKSHGGTDAEGFASAVDVGYDMVRYDLLDQDRADASNAPAARGGPRRAAVGGAAS